MDVKTNVFCASGMHLPNGSFATFGGNGAVTKGGDVGSQLNNEGSAAFDDLYQDYDGGRAIRVLNPCTYDINGKSFGPDVRAMQKRRWYSAAEPLGDGTIVLMTGGFTDGGDINRHVDPEGGALYCTYEYYPNIETAMDCVIKTEFVCAHGVWRGAGARRLARWRGGTRSPIAIDCITARRPTPRAPCSQPPSSSSPLRVPSRKSNQQLD